MHAKQLRDVTRYMRNKNTAMSCSTDLSPEQVQQQEPVQLVRRGRRPAMMIPRAEFGFFSERCTFNLNVSQGMMHALMLFMDYKSKTAN